MDGLRVGAASAAPLVSEEEQMAARPLCQTPGRPTLRAHNPEYGVVILFKPRCKLWSCPTCGPINAAEWTNKCRRGMHVLEEQGQALRFVTITSHRRLRPDATVRVFTHAWPMLRKRMRRAAAGCAYLMVPERHRDGRLHAHMMTTAHMKTAWYKDNAAECGMGYMADSRAVWDVAECAGYIAKYLVKDAHGARWPWPKGFRRVRTSRNWPRPPREAVPDGWDIAPTDNRTALANWLEWAQIASETVLLADHREAWDIIETLEGVYGEKEPTPVN